MRSSWNRDLIALILLLAVFRSPAFAERVRAKPAQRSATVLAPFETNGIGLNEALARQNALESLSEKVSQWLSREHPEITYVPNPLDVEGMVRHFSEPRPWTPREDSDLLDKGPWLAVTLKAELTSADLSQYEAITRNQLSQHRQGLLARGLTGAVALLAVGTGYFKLEEKVGRHKKKLGAAAVSLFGLVGLALLAWGYF
jgi:hypothetical protein